MQRINKQSVRLSLIALASVLLIIAINIADNTATDSKTNLSELNGEIKPSAYLSQSTFNLYNEHGKLSKLEATKAYFFSNKDAITIENPSFSTRNKTSNLILTADKGYFQPSDELLTLEGNVLAKQIISDENAWELSSDTLKVDNKAGILSTDQKIVISNGIHTLSALGFQASMNEKEIKLLSKVRGKYVLSK